jgi:HEAT repeat protein
METSFETLLDILSDESQEIPTDDLNLLSDLDVERLELFARAWHSFPAQRKQALIHKLGELADANIELSYTPINLIGLRDNDPEVRRISLRNLWEYDDPGLVPKLIQVLSEDSSPQVRATAAKALGNYMLLGAVRDLSPQLVEQIELCLIAGLENDDTTEIRQNCLESLGYSSSESITAVIENAYSSTDEDLKLSAIVAMGRTVDSDWAPIIIEELNNHSPAIRAEAARSAGELEARETIEPLIDLLDDVDVVVRGNAVWALGQIGGDEAQAALENYDVSIEDDEFVTILADAIDHLAFVSGSIDLLIPDIDQAEDTSN